MKDMLSENKRIIAVIAIVAIVAVAAVGVVYLMQPTGGPEPIRIGVLEPLTGGTSASGRGGYHGFQVAAEQLNKEGGIMGRPVVIVSEDTEGNPETASSAASKLITVDNVDFMMGTVLSSVVMQVAEVAADYETVFIATNPTTSAFTNLVSDNYDRYKYLFRTQWNVSQWMYAFFTSTTDLLEDVDSISFVTEDLTWAREATEHLEGFCNESGIDYQGVLFTPGTTDFSAEITQVEDFGPDLVLVDLLLGTSLGFHSQWWSLKPNITYVGASGLLSYPRTIEELGATDTDYMLTVNHMWNVSLSENSQDYFGDFIQISGQKPFGTDVTSYDALMALAQAIEQAGTTDTDAVIEALETYEFTGARESFTFMDNHQISYIPPVLLQWQDTEATVVWPSAHATGTYVEQPWL